MTKGFLPSGYPGNISDLQQLSNNDTLLSVLHQYIHTHRIVCLQHTEIEQHTHMSIINWVNEYVHTYMARKKRREQIHKMH